MANTTLHIKNMVCDRCIRAVREDLTALGHRIETIELGEVLIRGEIDEEERQKIRELLTEDGFELIDDKKSMIINRIKTLIIEYIHYDREMPGYRNLSDTLAGELGYDYSYLSNLFSSVEGQTIEKYFIHQKIEKVKELLVYGELSLSEISWKLGYSSAQHLSQQFKKITGLSPSHFKELGENRRKPLDKV